MSFSDLHAALAELQDDVIATTVCEDESWRAASFIDALRGLRHVKQLVDELQSEAEQAAAARAGAV